MPGKSSRIRDYEILELFSDSTDPVLSTTEVAELLSLTNPGAKHRLENLERNGYLQSKKAGNAIIWWHTSLTQYLDEISFNTDPYSIGVEVIDSLDITGEGTQLEARRLAVNEIYQLLFEQERVKSSTLKDRSAELTHETGYQGTSIWDNCIRPTLRQTILFDHSRSGTGIHDAVDWWYLTSVAEQLKGTWDENALWENWEQRKFEWERSIRIEKCDNVKQYLEEQDISFEGWKYENQRYIAPIEDTYQKLILSYELLDYPWFSYQGNLGVGIVVLTVSPGLSDSEKKQFVSNLDFQVDLEQLIYSGLAKIAIYSAVKIEPDFTSIARKDLKRIHRRIQAIRAMIDKYLN